MCRKWMNSFFSFLDAPSAMFTGTDTAALRICDVKPKRSSLGNSLVTLYKTFTSSKLFIQEFRFLCGFINVFYRKSVCLKNNQRAIEGMLQPTSVYQLKRNK